MDRKKEEGDADNAEVVAVPLSQGWTEHVNPDRHLNRKMYHNASTGVTTYEKPICLQSKAEVLANLAVPSDPKTHRLLDMRLAELVTY